MDGSIACRALLVVTITAGLDLLCPKDLVGEARCSAELSYTWKRVSKGTPSETTESAVVRRAEFFGPSEEEAKQGLEGKRGKLEVEAMLSCRQQHEDFSGCLASRYAKVSGQLKLLSFAARRDIEEAIKVECDTIRGFCEKGVLGEVKCMTEAKREEKEDEQPEVEKEGEKAKEGQKVKDGAGKKK